VALAVRDGLQRSNGVALVVYYEDPKTPFALPTLHAWFGRGMSSHYLSAYPAIITWRGYLRSQDVGWRGLTPKKLDDEHARQDLEPGTRRSSSRD
jgi:hypothetical protein